MTNLVVCPETDPAHPSLRTSDPAAIAAHLAGVGVVFEQWTADAHLTDDADQSGGQRQRRGDRRPGQSLVTHQVPHKLASEVRRAHRPGKTCPHRASTA